MFTWSFQRTLLEKLWSGIPHLFKNFSQFVVIHKDFGVVNEADVFLHFPRLYYDQFYQRKLGHSEGQTWPKFTWRAQAF